MAKRGGIFQTFGTLWRLAVWGLAAVLVLAVWLNWSKDETEIAALPEPAPETDTAGEGAGAAAEQDTSATTEETAAVSEDAAPETPATLEDRAEAAADAVRENAEALADEVRSEAGELAETAREEAGALAGEAREAAEGALAGIADEAGTAARDLAGAADAALGSLEAATGTDASAEMDLTVPGDPASYRILGLSQVEGGAFEITTSRTLDGKVSYATRRVSCDPLAVGLVAEGENEDELGQRNEAPEMAAVEAGGAVAEIAAAACKTTEVAQ